MRVPLADGTLVAAPVEEDSPLIPSLLTLSDVPQGYQDMDTRQALKVLVRP